MTDFDREAMQRYVVEPIELLAIYVGCLDTMLPAEQRDALGPIREELQEARAKMLAYFGEKSSVE